MRRSAIGGLWGRRSCRDDLKGEGDEGWYNVNIYSRCQ